MIHFNEIRITPDAKYLIIDASIDEDTYYDDVYLDLILIDTLDTFVSGGPSTKSIVIPVKEDSKNVRLKLSVLELQGLSLRDNMFFVYVIAKGTPAPNTPCGMDNAVLMKTVINFYPIYLNTIYYMKQLANNCTPSKQFIDMILRIKAIDLAVLTGNYPIAIEYWKEFVKGIKTTVITTNNCGCHA